MDKALEVIMVAMILVVAAVVILAMLQGRTQDFSGFTEDRVNSSNCGLMELKYQRALQCNSGTVEPTTADDIESNADSKGCTWAKANPDGSNYCS